MIIRDEKGLVSTARRRIITVTYEPATAKAVAALNAVELCRDLGIQEIILKEDLMVTDRIGKAMGRIAMLKFVQISFTFGKKTLDLWSSGVSKSGQI